jgi:hypothetical protein
VRIIPVEVAEATNAGEPDNLRDQLRDLEDELGYDPYLLIDSRFFRAQVRWDHQVGLEGWSAWITGGRDHQQNLVEGLGLIGGSGLQYAQLTQGFGAAGARGHVAVAEGAALEVGGELDVQPSRVTPLLPVTALGEAELAGTELAGPTVVTRVYAGPYAQLSIRRGGLQLNPALRASVHQLEGWTLVPEPQLSAELGVSKVWSVTAFAGLQSQGPSVLQVSEGFAPEQLSVTRASQATLGVKARWPTGVGLDVTAYETEMWGLVVRDVRQVIAAPPPDPLHPWEEEPAQWGELLTVPTYASARGRAYGIEAQLRVQPRGRQFGWIAGSLGHSTRAVEGAVYRADADVPVSLVAVYGVGLPKGWGLSGRGQIASGLVFTPLGGVNTGWEWDGSETVGYWDLEYDPLQGATNADRYPVYARLDLRIDKTWIRKRAKWTLYLDVYNLTNQHNPLWATYDWDYSELETRAYVPILPTLGLEVEY